MIEELGPLNWFNGCAHGLRASAWVLAVRIEVLSYCEAGLSRRRMPSASGRQYEFDKLGAVLDSWLPIALWVLSWGAYQSKKIM